MFVITTKIEDDIFVFLYEIYNNNKLVKCLIGTRLSMQYTKYCLMFPVGCRP